MKKIGKLILVSLIITAIFIFFSIPNFISPDKITKLITRMEAWPYFDEEEKEPTIDQKPEIDIPSTDEEIDLEIPSEEEPDKENPEIKDPIQNNEQPNKKPLETKTFTAQFINNDLGTVTIDHLSCTTTTTSCQITLPSFSSNQEFMGWSLQKDAKTSNLKSGQTFTLSANRLFYPVVKKTHTLTIVSNGAFNTNQTLTCDTYNHETSCEVTLPDMPRDYYTSFGYNDDASENITYQIGQTITLTNNRTLYPVRKINTAPYQEFASTADEVFTKLNAKRTKKGLPSLQKSTSLTLSAMLRVEELKQNYDFNVNGDYHYRISNNEPFYTVNNLAKRENYYSSMQLDADEYHQTFVNSKDHYANMMASDITMVGIAIGFDGTWLYIVELFG